MTVRPDRRCILLDDLMRSMTVMCVVCVLAVPVARTFPGDVHAQAARPQVQTLRVLVLSTMLAGNYGAGVGEWGFAALVEADGGAVLVDTGARPETVLTNARELGVDLSKVTDVIVTHHHGDHTSGLLTLRRALMTANPDALSRLHVARGMFWSRPRGAEEGNTMIALRAEYESIGGRVVEYAEAREIRPGLWLTGPVPRIHQERNWGSGRVVGPAGLVEDTVPEDMSIVADTDRGLVVMSGCGHSGIINTIDHARATIRQAPIHAALGGFHIFNLDDERLQWTVDKLKGAGLAYLLGAHCTGIEAVFRLRHGLGLPRTAAVVAAVGSSFTLGKGIDPLLLAR